VTGIGLILTAVDVFAVPWLRSALSPSAPTRAPERSGHVVVCGYTPRTAEFLEEVDSRGRQCVVVEPDEETAIDLHEADRAVVHGDPESLEPLRAAHVEDAAAVVVDAGDETSASIALATRELDSDVRVVTLVEDDDAAEYHRIAGADEVLSPRRILGESLARRVPTAVSTAVDEGVSVGDDLELVEFGVEEASDLRGRTLAGAGLRERYGIDVVGAWIDGDFESPVDADRPLDADVRLLVAGAPDQIEEFRGAITPTVRPLTPRKVVVIGYGQAGMAASETVDSVESEVTVLDIRDSEGVDVVGDAREPEVLREAGVTDASAVVITLNDDTTAIFATLVVRDIAPESEVVVRANDAGSVRKLHRAGADYVQSLATVSGRMLASTVFEDEEVLAVDERINVVKLPAGELVGRTLAEAEVRSRTGCTVLLVERDGEPIRRLGADEFRFERDDEVVVAGTDESVRAFERTFGA
ncbi:potassium channel family protein, partial [Haloparvum sedimenti]|uniref:potassium channel family protein n=1 Tax=Haloparvum sedimenti TaxID=1678448 RepID=UPI001FE0BA54